MDYGGLLARNHVLRSAQVRRRCSSNSHIERLQASLNFLVVYDNLVYGQLVRVHCDFVCSMHTVPVAVGFFC